MYIELFILILIWPNGDMYLDDSHFNMDSCKRSLYYNKSNSVHEIIAEVRDDLNLQMSVPVEYKCVTMEGILR